MQDDQKRFIIFFVILFASALVLGCVDQKAPEQKPKVSFEISPSVTSVPEGVPAKFTVRFTAPYDFDPVFGINPVYPNDANVLKIDYSQLTQIGHMYTIVFRKTYHS